MAKFPLDLSKFSKIHHDGKTATLRHPDGHEFKLALNALSPKMRGQVAELPHSDESKPKEGSPKSKDSPAPPKRMADGGEVKPKYANTEDFVEPKQGLVDPAEAPMTVPTSEPTPPPAPAWAPSSTPVADAAPKEAVKQVDEPTPMPEAGAQPKQPVDQFQAAQRRLYNQQAAGLNNPFAGQIFSSKLTPEQAAQVTARADEEDAKLHKQFPNLTFGPNGEPPAHFNPDIATRSAEQAAFYRQSGIKGRQDKALQIAEDNKARAQFGLPPVPVPPVDLGQASDKAPSAGLNVEHPQPSAPTTTQDTFGNQAYHDAYTKGLSEQKAGIFGEAKAHAQQAQLENAVLENNIQKQQDNQNEYKARYTNLDNERKAFMQDIQKQHIDPGHYMSSLGTESRISTAIGLILGGLGGGMMHTGGNAALDFLNKNIDRDIAAQQANLGKSENLLNANLKQFGNLRDATDMTRVMQIDIVANQLKQAAAKAVDPMAKARALQAAGVLDTQAAPILSQIAMRKTLMGGMQKGSIDPSQVIRMVVPEAQQQHAYKELKDAVQFSKTRDTLLSTFDQLVKLNTVSNRATSPLQTSRQVKALRDPIIAALSKETAGRFTEQDSHMIGSLFDTLGTSKESTDKIRNQLIKIIDEKSSFPMLSAYGINAGNVGRYDQNGQTKFQLAPAVK